MKKIPMAEIISEIRKVDEKLDRVPTSGDLREHADVSMYVLRDRFGGVPAAREAAGIDEHGGNLSSNHPGASEKDYIEDIQDVYEIVDRPPSVGDLDEHGKYESGSIISHFDTIGEARVAAGYAREYNHKSNKTEFREEVECQNCGKSETVWVSRAEDYVYCSDECMGKHKRKHSTDDILSSLESLCSELGRAPSVTEYRDNTGISHGVFEGRDELRSYSTEVRKLGYEPLCPRDISDEDLLKDLQALEVYLGRPPHVSDIHDYAQVNTTWPYTSRWGSFLSALEAAGIEPSPGQRVSISDDELISDFQRVAKDLGEAPSYNDIIEFGRYSPYTYERAFGSFLDAKQACGFEPKASGSRWRHFSEAEIKDEIQRVDDIVDSVPSVKDIEEESKISISTLAYRFGKFKDALRAAGIDPKPAKIPKEELIDAMLSLADKKDRPPFQEEMNADGRYSFSVYVNRWGSWLNAKEAAGLDTKQRKPSLRVSEQEAIQDLQDLASEMGRCPSYYEYQDEGQYSVGLFKQKFGSWTDAKDEAGFGRGRVNANYGTDEDTNGPVYGPSWLSQREKARERDGFECQSCGMTKEEHLEKYDTVPHVHHITPWHQFEDHEERNKLSNLIVLCVPCHRKYESLPVKPQIV